MAYIPTLRTRTYECKIQTPLALHEHHHQTELMITSSVTTSAHPKLPRNRHRPERSRVTTSAPHAPEVRLVCDNGLTAWPAGDVEPRPSRSPACVVSQLRTSGTADAAAHIQNKWTTLIHRWDQIKPAKDRSSYVWWTKSCDMGLV